MAGSGAEPNGSIFSHCRKVLVCLLGYGSLVSFSLFLVFVAKRYHSVYGWAHQPNRNISPEQFYRSANNANNAILIVVAISIFFAFRDRYLPGRIIGGLCVIACLIVFIHGCGHVAVRY